MSAPLSIAEQYTEHEHYYSIPCEWEHFWRRADGSPVTQHSTVQTPAGKRITKMMCICGAKRDV